MNRQRRTAWTLFLFAASGGAIAQEAGAPLPASPSRTPKIYGKPIVVPNCNVMPYNDVKVPSHQPGVLVELPIKEGMRVKKGDVLGRIEDSLAKIDLEQKTLQANSEAGRRAALAAEKEASAKLASAQTLYDRRQMSEEQYRETQASLEIAKERVNDANSKHEQDVVEMKAAQERLRLHTIVSPCDGIIVEKFKQEGEAVQVQDPSIARIIRTDVVKVKAPVSIRDARLLRKGMQVEVFPNRQAGERQLLLAHTGQVTSVKALGDGVHCVSAGVDGRIVVWNLEQGRQENILVSGDTAVLGLATSPADPKILVSIGADRKITVWDWAAGKVVAAIPMNLSQNKNPTSVALNAKDPNVCVTGDEDRTVRLWDLKSATETRAFAGHTGFVTSVSLSPDGDFAVSAGDDGTVRIWDLKAGKLYSTIRGRSNNVRHLGLSANGKYSLFNNQHLLQVLTVPEGKLIANIEALNGRFSDVAVFCPTDPRLILAGHESRELQLWQFRTDQLIPRLVRTFSGSGSVEDVTCVDFTPDGSFAVTGGKDRSVRVFDVPSAEEIEKERKLGRIEFINDHVEGGSNTVSVTIEVANADNALLSGSFATVIFYPESASATAN